MTRTTSILVAILALTSCAPSWGLKGIGTIQGLTTATPMPAASGAGNDPVFYLVVTGGILLLFAVSTILYIRQTEGKR